MQNALIQEALAAGHVFFSFTDDKLASRVFKRGQVGLTFDYLSLDQFLNGGRGVFRSTRDESWAALFTRAPKGGAVVTRRNGNELWWSTFADEVIRDGGDYKYRSTRSGWHRLATAELGDLAKWLSVQTWAAKANRKPNPIEAFHTAVRNHSWPPLSLSHGSALNLAKRAFAAHRQSGKSKTGVYKDKLFGFASEEDLAEFIGRQFVAQQGMCALTGLTMLDLDTGVSEIERDQEISLDRIASDRGYEPENLQLACSFANRWKSDGDNDHFKALLDVVRRAPDAFA